MCNVPPPVRVLKKTPRTPKIDSTDVLELDPEFKNAKRVRVAGLSMVKGVCADVLCWRVFFRLPCDRTVGAWGGDGWCQLLQELTLVVPQLGGEKEENQGVAEERKVVVDAVIVRILKARKRIDHKVGGLQDRAACVEGASGM